MSTMIGLSRLENTRQIDTHFCAAVGGLELLPQVPPYLPRYASFLFSFLGRGICKLPSHPLQTPPIELKNAFSNGPSAVYVFVGSIVVEGNTLRLIAGLIVVVIGVAYCGLEFAPQIEPPSNMRDADAGWGAEQV